MNARQILSKVIELSNASVDVDRRLSNLVEALAEIFAIPFCALFLWDPQQVRLSLKFCSKKHPAFPPGLSLSLDEGPLRTCALQKKPVIINDASKLPPGDRLLPKHFAPFNFLASFPLLDDIYFYGMLTLLGEQPREFSEEESLLLPVICRQLAGTIRTARVSLQAKKRIAELSTLHNIGMAISSTSDLGQLLNRITLISTKILQADGCILRLLDEETGVLKVVSSFGLEEEEESLKPVPLGEDVAGNVALTGKPILIRDAQTSPYSFKKFRQEISSIICVPLIFKAKTIGTLALFSTRREGDQEKVFDEEDRNLLSTMALQIANAIENAIILQRAEILARDKEGAVQDLSVLYEVSRSMLTTIRLDELLRIILISVTLGHDRGFDRAALFLVDERENVLQGMLGVGPETRQESDYWRQKLEEQSIFAPDWIFPKEMEKTAYDLRVRQARISLNEKRSILIKTIKEKRSFNVEDAANDPEVNLEILSWFGSRAFASVPLIAKDRAIGVIAVDNLFTGRPITARDIGLLNLLANQAALAIETSRLYSNLQEINTQLLQAQNRLIQSEKLAALGEAVASFTHEIKNPLVSIGGFARRLYRNLRENSPEKKYTHIILEEVKRLESILNKTLAFSKELPIPSSFHDLNGIIEETLMVLEDELEERNIIVNKTLTPNLPPLIIDPQQMKQVFLNLFVNAIQAMGQNGCLSVQTSLQRLGESDLIQAEVKDTGGGIKLEILDNIFNPFFTTRENGTGLGLAIVHKIITQHRGQIEVINHPGVGATFVIRFPLSE